MDNDCAHVSELHSHSLSEAPPLPTHTPTHRHGPPPATSLQAFSELQATYSEAFMSAPAKLPSDFSPTTRSFKMVAECTVTRELSHTHKQQ